MQYETINTTSLQYPRKWVRPPDGSFLMAYPFDIAAHGYNCGK